MQTFVKYGPLTAVLLVAPFLVTNAYYLHLLVVILIYSILLLGLDIVFGYTGEVSLGHAALLGIGSYTAGIMSLKLGIGMLVALPFGIIVAALFGLVLALPALQVTGPYLAMVTLAFGTIIYTLINEMDFLTNGPLGITLVKPLYWDLRDYADQIPFFRYVDGADQGVQLLLRRARVLVGQPRGDQPAHCQSLRPRVRSAARCADRVGLHGRERL